MQELKFRQYDDLTQSPVKDCSVILFGEKIERKAWPQGQHQTLLVSQDNKRVFGLSVRIQHLYKNDIGPYIISHGNGTNIVL
jgi:hypothetical protein